MAMSDARATLRRMMSVFVMRVMMIMMVMMLTLRPVDARCTKTKSGKGYSLTIGMLSAGENDFSAHRIVQKNLMMTGEVKDCFLPPHYLNLAVNETLQIPRKGWTKIQGGIEDALSTQGALDGEIPNLIIGPFYTNLAMMLQRMGIPYLVTDYKGFDWIDMSRVQDTVNWRTVVEIRPPAQAQNLAVVDLFLERKWSSAMMVMPESAADNQECQNLASQMLNHSLSLIPFTVEPRDPEVRTALSELLRNAKMFRQTQVLVCSPRDYRDQLIENILKEARPFGLLMDPDFSFIFVDPSSYLAPFAGASEMYSLGLFSALCELLAFRYVVPSTESHVGKEAAADDAARVTTLALNTYISSQTDVTNDFSSERFLNALKSVKLPTGATGALEFDELGQRANYTLHLYNHGGDDMYKKLAEWDPNQLTFDTRLNITEGGDDDDMLTQIGIFPEVVQIVVVEERPFVIIRNDSASQTRTGIDRMEGFTIDLIKRLATELNFQYDVYISPKNRYGGLTADGTWDGMVGEVIAGNATLACGSISITSSRESVIDFSLGVMSTGVNLLVKKPKENFTIFQFIMPFSLELWMAILGASAAVSFVFFVMDYCSVEDRRFTIKETIWFAVGTLLKRGTDFAPVPVSQRILTAGFLFFVIITVSTYTANMAAFLTTKNFGETIDSFESLAESDTVSVSTVRNSATMGFLERGTEQTYKRLWQKVRNSAGLVKDAKEGVARVKRGGTAFMFDYLINEAAENMNCDTMAVGAPILLQEHGIGMVAGAPFKSNINFALLKMKEDGFMAKLKKKWWDDKRQCDVGSDSQRTGQVQFGVNHTAGVFIVGLFGVCVAALLFFCKKIYWCIKNAILKRLRRDLKAEENHAAVKANEEALKERQKLFEGDRGEAV